MQLKQRKQRKITNKELKQIANDNNAKKAKIEPISVFGDTEFVLFLDNQRSGRISFHRIMEDIGVWEVIPVVHIAQGI